MSIQYLQEKHQSKVFKKYFAFFAFNKKQLDEQINSNFDYVALGSGLCVPKPFAHKIMDKLGEIHKAAIAEHQRTTSKKDIIWDALANYEAQITGSITDAWESLSDYPGITKQDVLDQYVPYCNMCVDKGYF